jgi:ankyrin repeat protein
VASIANRITQAADPDKVLLYVTCAGSTSGAGLGNTQSYTADSICRTFLSQLYDLAIQGEDNVGLLEACNAVFKRAKAKASSLPNHMRTGNDELPEFAEGFSRLAALLKKNVVLVLDGLDKNAIDDKNQQDLLRKVRALIDAVTDRASISLRVLVGCSSSAKFLHGLDLAPDSYIQVQYRNRKDIELVLTDALKDIPGLSAAERESAKAAILEKARSRFLYVRDTAIPFMREPFQRPLSKRLEALPDGASDVYAKALRTLSPNYLDLLRTALTWTLLCPVWPGYPHAREIMDAFQGTYDFPPDAEGGDDADVEAEFPVTSRLELEQLRGATDQFLTLFPEADGTVWVWETDAAALAEYFIKSDADDKGEPVNTDQDDHDQSDDHEQLCARCGSTLALAKPLYIDPKKVHLQMALTCLRHLNNRLFQRRAGLITADIHPEDADTENSGEDGQNGEEGDAIPTDPAATPGAEDAEDSDPTVDDFLQQAQDGYQTENSIDDEDVTKPQVYDQDADDSDSDDGDESDGDSQPRIRYEMQYWPRHMRKAEELWSAEEREGNSDWAALMSELDKLVFEAPDVFASWQSKYPDRKNKENIFAISNGPHNPLHVAAYLGLTSWVKHLLDRGEDLNGLSAGYSPLQAAACSGGPLDAMKLLLEKGADINAQNKAGRSSLHLWLMRGDITLDGMKLLLQHGADAKASCSLMHYTVMQYFANRGEDPEVLELLLAHGADINAIDPDSEWKMPALHFLLMRRDVPLPLLEAFIKHKADTNAENAVSVRALQIVCGNGSLDLLKIILQSEILEIDDPDLHGTTAVHEAAFYGHHKCVGALLEKGANADITDKVNRTALHSAARRGLVEVVRVLLQYTKQVNLLDHAGWSPLFCACLGKEEEAALLILDALIKHGLPLSEINKPTRSGRTVLRQAADHGFDKVVSRLIQLATDRNDAAGLDINARDTKKGMTALHRAAMNGHAACVQALITAGADPSLVDSQSRPAIALAYEQWSVVTKKSSYEEIISTLITANPTAAVSDPELIAVCAANGSVRLLTQLWRLNAPLNRPDRFGWTPLDLARHFCRKETETFLKQQAAWANLLPSRWESRFPGTTPLGAASVCEGGKKILHTSGKRLAVSADRPLPAGLERYYFEITLLDVPDPKQHDIEFKEMAIGFCTLGGAALEFPGWYAAFESKSTAKSWGYHSDTGGLYSSEEEHQTDDLFEEARYKVGDTVGCGVDLAKGEIWFTKNGVRLDRVCKGVQGRLFPVVGLHEEVCFVTNFGREGEGEFRYKPGADVKEEKGEKEGATVKVFVLGGKGESEEKAGVTVTTEEVVVAAN